MSLTSDVVANAIAIANDNKFRYHYSHEGNGSGAVTVPYTMDCCTFISYSIYLAMGWTWYNQPYSYYWPHVSQSGYDYFLTNTIGCSKQLWHSVSDRRSGDIIITDEYYGHTLMLVNENQIIDAVPCSNYGVAQSIAVRPYPHYDTSHFLYLYRFPDSGESSDLLKDGNHVNQADYPSTDITWVWNMNTVPPECTVRGTATAIRFNSIYIDDIVNTPFEVGKTYRLKYHGTNVRFRGYFYDKAGGGGNLISQFNVISDYDFTIPQGTERIILRLWVAKGSFVNETVAPEIVSIPKPLPDIPPITPTNIKTGMPVWMMLNPFM